jgi:hypothetical protein
MKACPAGVLLLISSGILVVTMLLALAWRRMEAVRQ